MYSEFGSPCDDDDNDDDEQEEEEEEEKEDADDLDVGSPPGSYQFGG